MSYKDMLIMKRYFPNHKIFQVLFHNLFKSCLCQALIIETNLIFFYVDFNMPGLLAVLVEKLFSNSVMKRGQADLLKMRIKEFINLSQL